MSTKKGRKVCDSTSWRKFFSLLYARCTFVDRSFSGNALAYRKSPLKTGTPFSPALVTGYAFPTKYSHYIYTMCSKRKFEKLKIDHQSKNLKENQREGFQRFLLRINHTRSVYNETKMWNLFITRSRKLKFSNCLDFSKYWMHSLGIFVESGDLATWFESIFTQFFLIPIRFIIKNKTKKPICVCFIKTGFQRLQW